MRSVKWSAQGWNTAAGCLAVVIVFVAQSFGLEAVWTQELPQPRLDEEFTKQEKIYRSRGTDVPGGYVINRGLSDYTEVLPTGFCDALGRLGSSDRWLDIGAGEGQAILDYYAPQGDGTPEQCGGSGPKARVVAISIEDRRADGWKKQTANDRMRYLAGKRLSQYSRDELGKFQIITDVYGGFTYTENLSRFLENVLSLLEMGGTFYTVLPAVHLEDGTDKLGTWYKTELVDAASRPIKVCFWLRQTTCTKISCESKSDWDEPTQLIKIRRACNDVAVPRTNLVEYMAGAPPGRRFQLEP